MYAPGRKLNWARVAYREDGNCHAKPKVGGITQNLDLGYACFQEKYYRVCIARAAANESVYEDSHAEHVQFATAAVSV